MPPAGLSQTEMVVWDWLLDEKGYDESEITRQGRSQTPSFICPDESYEVKRPYSKQKILVSEKQAATLTEIDPIIVVAHEHVDEPQETFRWSERADAGMVVHIHESPSRNTLAISDGAKRRLDKMIADLDPGMDYEDAVERVVDVFETHPGIFKNEYR